METLAATMRVEPGDGELVLTIALERHLVIKIMSATELQ